jgi:putative redox protein
MTPPASSSPGSTSASTPASTSGPTPGPGAPDAPFEAVATIGNDDLVVTVEAGGHTFQSDALPESGGTNVAPNPFRLLLGSLGACTAMTIRMYADRKQWPLEGVRIQLRHDQRRAEAGEVGATDAGRVFTIEKRVELLGEGLDDEQRTRLLAIGEKCPVNQALMSQVRIVHPET